MRAGAKLWTDGDGQPYRWWPQAFVLSISPGWSCCLMVHSAVLRAAMWWNVAARRAGSPINLFRSARRTDDPDVFVMSTCYPDPTFDPESMFSAPRAGMLSPVPAWRLDGTGPDQILGHTDLRVREGTAGIVAAEVSVEQRLTLDETTEIAVHELGHVLGLDSDGRLTELGVAYCVARFGERNDG